MGREGYKSETFTKLYNEGLFYKYSPTELSKILGASRSTLKAWKDGTSFPEIDKLVKVSKLLNVSVDYLLGLTDCNSLDGNYQTAVKFTGLEEETVKRLNDEQYDGFLLALFNNLVQSETFNDITAILMKAKSLAETVSSEQSKKDALGKNIVVDGVETEFTKSDLINLYCNDIGTAIYQHIMNCLVVIMNVRAEVGEEFLKTYSLK